LQYKIWDKINILLTIPTFEWLATWLNRIEQTSRMLFISTSAARKDKGATKPNLREIHHSGLTLVPIVISINKSPVGIP
jgi:hypothetical protein